MGMLKAGLVLLSAKWFLDVGIQNNDSGRYSELNGLIEKDIKSIIGTLEKHFEVIYPGSVYSLETAGHAVEKFNAGHVDCVIIVHIMWSEDGPMIKILKEIGKTPVLLWCYNPFQKLPEKMKAFEMYRSSGAVGILQGSGPIKKMEMEFSFVFGYPGGKELENELSEFADVLWTATGIRKLRIGQIGPRCEPMTGNYVDEFRLMAELGPTLVPISSYRLYETAANLSETSVDRYIKLLKESYKVNGVTDRSLFHAAKASLALEMLVEEEGLGAVAINDLDMEMHKLLKNRPCLWTPGLSDKRTVVGMETDVMNTIGMWIAKQLGGSAPMFTEIYTYDQEENVLLMGHPGMHDLELAGNNEITIIPDFEYDATDEVEGAWQYFAAKPGPVIVSSMFADNEAYRIFTFKGEALPVKDKIEGFTSVYVKIETPLRNFFEKAIRTGMTQHFTVSYDDIGKKLKKFCDITGIEFVNAI